jgi:hypothetical protein
VDRGVTGASADDALAACSGGTVPVPTVIRRRRNQPPSAATAVAPTAVAVTVQVALPLRSPAAAGGADTCGRLEGSTPVATALGEALAVSVADGRTVGYTLGDSVRATGTYSSPLLSPRPPLPEPVVLGGGGLGGAGEVGAPDALADGSTEAEEDGEGSPLGEVLGDGDGLGSDVGTDDIPAATS